MSTVITTSDAASGVLFSGRPGIASKASYSNQRAPARPGVWRMSGSDLVVHYKIDLGILAVSLGGEPGHI
ncbi:hypothetical protein KGA66_01205 [Actinocrinis puniceicyclus]|uniref:Uncharacterized protein n=1 Tax=Actinocrinis puniceicyclus TaxID=977794 RepID=A0A8J8BAQ8_9ACTN|nr:hypothetical protein [Actinocrinis puniceicyclus]MBS2961645.1 hypothetical protein [Actinocrinis puniceicyclus]